MLQDIANSEFQDVSTGYFTDILRHVAGSLSDWAAVNRTQSLQFTIESNTDGSFDVKKHVWTETPDSNDKASDRSSTGIQIQNCKTLDEAIEAAERQFHNEANTWQSHSTNTQLIRGEAPASEDREWQHIESAHDAPVYVVAGSAPIARKPAA